MVSMTIDESQEDKEFLNTKTRSELESDLEQCLERKKSLEEAKTALHNFKIDLETMLKQRDIKISELESHLAAVHSEKEAIETNLTTLEESRSHDQGALEELREQIHQIGQEKTHLENENYELKKSMELLEHDKETYKAYSDEAEKILEVKTEKLLADLRYIQEENQRHMVMIAEKEEIIRNYEEKIQELSEKQNTFIQQMTDRQDIRTVSKEFMDSLESKLGDLQNLMNSFGSQLQGPGIPPAIPEEFQERGGGEPESSEPEEPAGEFVEDIEDMEEIPSAESGPPEPDARFEPEAEEDKKEEEEEFSLPEKEEPEGSTPSERFFDLSNSFESEDIFQSDLDLELPEPEDLSSLEEELMSVEEFEEEDNGYENEREPVSNKNMGPGEPSQDKETTNKDKELEKEKFPWEEEDNSLSWGF